MRLLAPTVATSMTLPNPTDIEGVRSGDSASSPDSPRMGGTSAEATGQARSAAVAEPSTPRPDLSMAHSESAPLADVVIVKLGTTASEMQKLVDSAPPGTVLQLEAGHYKFNKTITIDRDDITVLGAGSGKTFIDLPSNHGEEAFQIGSGTRKGAFTLADDMDEGSTVMTLSGAHSFAVGDYVYLERESTKAFYTQIGDTAWANTDVPLRTSIAKVVAVDGAKITLSTGAHFDFSKGETTVSEISMAENVTLGGFTVDFGLSTAKPSDFSNTLGSYHRNAVIEVDGTANLALTDIVSHDVPSLGLNVASSTGIRADGITMTGAHNKGGGGNGYGLQIRDVYDSSFTNISDTDMRHSVVFASWTSAAGNFVHVAQTDRDINFHGGRDHSNVVVVDRSIRDANSDIISPTLFVNTTGTHYGSATGVDANTVTFGTVVGTRLNDAVIGYDTGAVMNGMGGHDSLTGGSGNDLLIGGAGNDTLNGMGGEDIAAYSGNHTNFAITDLGGGVYSVRDRVGGQSTDRVSGVEWLVFDDKVIDLRDLSIKPLSTIEGIFTGAGTWQTDTPDPAPVPPPAPPPVSPPEPSPVFPVLEVVGTSGKDIINVTSPGTTFKGLGNFDTVRSTVDFTLSDDVERLDLMGHGAINGTGGSNANHMHGNDANNVLQGMAGDDRLWGKGGDDLILGGAGNDQIRGDAGDDRIDGGAGQDKLFGGAGADVFIFTSASDTSRTKSDKIRDFETGIDKIDLSRIDANTELAGDQAFVFGASAEGAASLWVQNGYLMGDTNNDGVADLAIYVVGTVVATDILF